MTAVLRPMSAGSEHSRVLFNVRAMELIREQSEVQSGMLDKDEEYLLKMVEMNPEALKNVGDLCKDKDFILRAVRRNGLALQYAHSSLRADRQVALAAVTHRGLALRFADEDLRSDFDFMLDAIRANPEALAGAAEFCRGDPELLAHSAPELKDDRDFALYMVRVRGLALRSVGKKFLVDKEVVHDAVRNDGLALQYAHPTVRNIFAVVQQAVRQNGNALEFASPNLQDNSDLVMTAISDTPMALQFASERRRDDLSIVVCAAKRSVHALKFSGPTARKDKKLMQMFLKMDGLVLQYVDDRLKDDVPTVLLAIQSNPHAARFASKKALEHKLVKKALANAAKESRADESQSYSESVDLDVKMVSRFRKSVVESREATPQNEESGVKIQQQPATHIPKPADDVVFRVRESRKMKIARDSVKMMLASEEANPNAVQKAKHALAKFDEDAHERLDFPDPCHPSRPSSAVASTSVSPASRPTSAPAVGLVRSASVGLMRSASKESRYAVAAHAAERPSSASAILRTLASRQEAALISNRLALGDGWKAPPKESAFDAAVARGRSRPSSSSSVPAVPRFSVFGEHCPDRLSQVSRPSMFGSAETSTNKPAPDARPSASWSRPASTGQNSSTQGRVLTGSKRPTSAHAAGARNRHFGSQLSWQKTTDLDESSVVGHALEADERDCNSSDTDSRSSPCANAYEKPRAASKFNRMPFRHGVNTIHEGDKTQVGTSAAQSNSRKGAINALDQESQNSAAARIRSHFSGEMRSSSVHGGETPPSPIAPPLPAFPSNMYQKDRATEAANRKRQEMGRNHRPVSALSDGSSGAAIEAVSQSPRPPMLVGAPSQSSRPSSGARTPPVPAVPFARLAPHAHTIAAEASRAEQQHHLELSLDFSQDDSEDFDTGLSTQNSSQWDFLQSEHQRLAGDPSEAMPAGFLGDLMSEGEHLRAERERLRGENHHLTTSDDELFRRLLLAGTSVRSTQSSTNWDACEYEHQRILAEQPSQRGASKLRPLIEEGNQLREERKQLLAGSLAVADHHGKLAL